MSAPGHVDGSGPSWDRLRRRLRLLLLGTLLALAGCLALLALYAGESASNAAEVQALEQARAELLRLRERLGERLDAPDASEDVAGELERVVGSKLHYRYAVVRDAEWKVLFRAGSGDEGLPPRSVGPEVGVAPGPAGRDLAVAWHGASRHVTLHLGLSEDRLSDELAPRGSAARWSVAGAGALVVGVLCLMAGLAWRELRATQRAASAAHRSAHLAEVGQLASGLVHEVRNPLNAMRMQLGLARRKLRGVDAAPAAEAAEAVERVEEEVLRLERLARDVLSFGRAGLEPAEPVEVAATLRDLVEEQRAALEPGERLELEVDPSAEGARSALGAPALRQVLLNLVGNAREASGRAGSVTLRVTPAPPGLRLEVADQGPGIDPEQLGHVFEPFVSFREGGTGLGLAIVRRLLERAGGAIELDSTPGRGTTARVTLPGAPP
ncbi:MAG: HAMP domain-containing sensor histidine kinase [Planctomycetota bacterium]